MNSQHYKFLLITSLLTLFSVPGLAQQAEFIWTEEDENGGRILLSEYKNGGWQPGEVVVDDGEFNILPALGADNKGRRIAVWSTIERDKSLLKFTWQVNGRWQKPKVLSDQMTTSLAPALVVDNNDTPWVFWAGNNGDDDDDIYMSRYSSGQWTGPERVNDDNAVPDILPEAGLDEGGNVWVSWQELTQAGYVELSMAYEVATKRQMAASKAMSTQQVRQLKALSDLENPMQPPAFFNSRGRASLYFPNDRKRPSRAVQGKW